MNWTARFDEFHERAISQQGGADFGDHQYHAGLKALLGALDDSPPAAGAPTAVAEQLVVSALVARLHTQAQWTAHPGHQSRQITAPLIVMGVPRTGTTALHKLLSLDPQFQGIEQWLTGAPQPRPPQSTWAGHPQFQAAAALTDHLFATAPELMQAHGVRADEVDECLLPMAQSFTCNWFPSQLDVPSYDRWLMSADERPSFARYKAVLQLVGLHDDRRWLLKNPSHVFGVDAMLAVFPDACVVQTHRHPADSLASLVNLLDNFMQALAGIPIDRAWRLRRETAFWGEAVRRSMALQDRHPERFVNVLQPEIRRDPLAVVEKIYSRFGLTLSAPAEAAMRGWAARNAENPSSGHRYAAIADTGPVQDAFGDYIARYQL